ncbi:MAG: UDP-N-acetylmuramoyl-L-alanine--D-glutamate ligase [Clostridia bacterium]|nr:UDP-N-acetylmuramoyl-L-alanine--D-glutamate ligase [Clostridia bacterium]
MYFKNQKFMVAGMSKSGEGCARFLLERGAEVYVYDDVISENITALMETLSVLGAHIVTAENYADSIYRCDILILSPGIPIDNALPVAFRKQGKAIIGEEELGALYLRATAIAVTGTNGKTTTVSMLNSVLEAAGKHSVACGNIGNPLINEVEKLGFDDYAVIEISSFQLETLSSLRPHIAVITNVTEDHLNRHYNMENYVFLKNKILRNLRESEYAVLNYDDEIVKGFAQTTKAKAVYFSMRGRIDGGAYYENGSVYFNGEKYFDVDDMAIGGAHNVYNALACVAVAHILGLDKVKVAEAVCSFKGVKHRIEILRTVNGVTYVDDSKGTNVDATVKAVGAMTQPTIVLLGGKDKGYDYIPLFTQLKESKAVHAVMYGENRFKLLNAAIKAGFVSFSLCAEFETAVRLAQFIAKSGQTVLLSPASSSFDSFSNYEERGNAFAKLVEGIAEETNEAVEE